MSEVVKSVSIIIVVDDHTVIHHNIHALAEQDAVSELAETIIVNPYPNHSWVCRSMAQVDAQKARRANVTVIDQEGATRAQCRNIGLRHSKGDLVILLADDFIPRRGWLKEHLELHESRPDDLMVGIGPACFTDERRKDPFMAWLDDSGLQFGVSFTRNETIPNHFFYGSNTSIKRSFLERVGSFDEMFKFHTSEDWELGMRLMAAGMKTTYLPRAMVEHDHDVDLPGRRIATIECGQSNARHDLKHNGFTRPPYGPHSAWGHQWRSWLAMLHWLVMRHRKARHRYWKHTLGQAYMEGYEAVKRGGSAGV